MEPPLSLRRTLSWEEYWACEQSIASARASVMIYDDVNKKWVPSGSSSGLSKVHIYQHQVNNTFRVVGRKLHDHEVVINCAILKGLKYNQATATFHQWRDNKQVYGLNFSSKEDGDAFARAMLHALDTLNNTLPRAAGQPPLPPGPQGLYQQGTSQYDEDMGYSQMVSLPRVVLSHQGVPGSPTRIAGGEGHSSIVSGSCVDRTMTREDVAIIQERRMSQQQQQQQMVSSPGSSSPGAPAPPAAPGHHRTSSAPPAPQPPPMALAPTPSPQSGPPPAPPAPPAPPCPPWMMASQPSAPPAAPVCIPVPPLAPPAAPAGPPMGAPPPPPPPPVPNMSRSSSSDSQDQTSSLAAQLQSAKLKRSNKQSQENSGSSTSSSGSSNYGTIGRSGIASMSSMMDEMAKTLARRRKAAEKKDPEPDADASQDKKLWEKGGSNGKFANGSGSESPKPARKRFGSTSEDSAPRVNGLPDAASAPCADFESLKQEILKEMRKEIGKMKQDIIDAIKMELSRR